MDHPESVPKLDVSLERLIALPVQVISVEGGVLLVRGVKEIYITGENAEHLVSVVLTAASGSGVTRRDLIEKFAATERETVSKLIETLVSRSILVPAGNSGVPDAVESGLEVFYWHFGQTAAVTIDNINKKRIAVLGVNSISRSMVSALRSIGVANVKVIDFHILRNLRMHDPVGNLLPEEWPLPSPLTYEEWSESLEQEEISCLVATCDFGGTDLMLEWNRFCVETGCHFLPVVQDRFTGTIGPLVIPGETPCYACLLLRQNSNIIAPARERLAETSAPDRQAVIGLHPAMTAVLGQLAAMELCKLYGGGIPWYASRLIEMNVLGPTIVSRNVLKLPLCPVCSPATKISSAYLSKDSFVPGQLLNFHDFR